MTEVHIAAEGHVAAPAGRVYALIADYQQHHPRFLPPAFSDLTVERGGVGAGTLISFVLTAGGRKRAYRMEIEEPEPGRVLVERDQLSTAVTTWTVTPADGGTRVQIDTRWQGASGVAGFFERTFAPRAVRALYADELERLARYAREQAAT